MQENFPIFLVFFFSLPALSLALPPNFISEKIEFDTKNILIIYNFTWLLLNYNLTWLKQKWPIIKCQNMTKN